MLLDKLKQLYREYKRNKENEGLPNFVGLTQQELLDKSKNKTLSPEEAAKINEFFGFPYDEEFVRECSENWTPDDSSPLW